MAWETVIGRHKNSKKILLYSKWIIKDAEHV